MIRSIDAILNTDIKQLSIIHLVKFSLWGSQNWLKYSLTEMALWKVKKIEMQYAPRKKSVKNYREILDKNYRAAL